MHRKQIQKDVLCVQILKKITNKKRNASKPFLDKPRTLLAFFFDIKEHLMFYVLFLLYVALSDLFTFTSTEIIIHFFAPIVNEKIKVVSVNFSTPKDVKWGQKKQSDYKIAGNSPPLGGPGSFDQPEINQD